MAANDKHNESKRLARQISRVYSLRRRRIRWHGSLMHAIIIFFCLVILVPIAWVLLLSVKSLRDAYTGTLWPEQFDFTHYAYVFQHMPQVVHNFTNSIIVTLSTVVITTVIAVLWRLCAGASPDARQRSSW